MSSRLVCIFWIVRGSNDGRYLLDNKTKNLAWEILSYSVLLVIHFFFFFLVIHFWWNLDSVYTIMIDPLPHTDALFSLFGLWLPCVDTFSPCSGWFLMLFCLPSLTRCSLRPPWTLIFSNLALSHLMALEMSYSGRGRSTNQAFPCNVFLILFNPELSLRESKRNHQGPKERRNWEPK